MLTVARALNFGPAFLNIYLDFMRTSELTFFISEHTEKLLVVPTCHFSATETNLIQFISVTYKHVMTF